MRENRLEPGAADALIGYLRRQREATGRDLPHRHHVLVEHVRDRLGGPEGCTVVVHTLWGGAINKPFSLALRAAWRERFGWAPELFQDNDAMLLFLPADIGARELLGLVTPENLERLLRAGLEASGFFGARFRESAGRALLLPRTSGARRMPLWLTRQRAKNLFDAAARYEDFPMLLEAWRTCLRDEFDLAGTRHAPGRDRLGRDPGGRVLDPRAVAVLLGRAVAGDQRVHVRGRHAARVRGHRPARRPGARARAVHGPAAARGPVARRRARLPARADR